MLEGMQPFDAEPFDGWDLHRWSDEVRQGRVKIMLAGFSHIFVHDDDEYVDAGGLVPMKGMPHCVQQVFDKQRVAARLRAFADSNRTGILDDQAANAWGSALISSTVDKPGPAPSKCDDGPAPQPANDPGELYNEPNGGVFEDNEDSGQATDPSSPADTVAGAKPTDKDDATTHEPADGTPSPQPAGETSDGQETAAADDDDAAPCMPSADLIR